MKKYGIFIFACLMASCNEGRNNTITPAEASLEVEASNSIIEWAKGGTISNEDFLPKEMDSVIILPLHENINHMQGQIMQLAVHNDTLVVADTRQVCLYNADGRYLSSVGAMGRGPNEYLDFGGMYVLDDSIYIEDKGTGNILTYDFNGELIRKRHFENGAPESFVVLRNGTVLGGYSGYRQNSEFRLRIFNTEAREIDTAFPYTQPQQYVAGDFISPSSDKALFTYPLCDTIFSVSTNRITPVIRMNMHDRNVVSAFVSKTSGFNQEDFRQAMYTTEKLVNMVDIFPYDNGYMLYYQDSKGSYYSFVSTEYRRDYLRGDIKKKEIYYPFNVIASHKNWIYGYLDPAAYSFMNEETKQKWQKYIVSHSSQPISVKDLENGDPLLIKMHVRN